MQVLRSIRVQQARSKGDQAGERMARFMHLASEKTERRDYNQCKLHGASEMEGSTWIAGKKRADRANGLAN